MVDRCNLRGVSEHELLRLLENISLTTKMWMYFQYDGMSPHISRQEMRYLDHHFPGRCIDRGEGVRKIDHCDHRRSTLLTTMCEGTRQTLFMNARWTHVRTSSHYRCGHTRTNGRDTSSRYTFYCETDKIVYGNWRQTFWTYVKASHVQPVSVISWYNKYVCLIQIILTFATHSSVADGNHTHVGTAFFTHNGLGNNLRKLWHKVMIHSAYFARFISA
jgi:hypothetical protein